VTEVGGGRPDAGGPRPDDEGRTYPDRPVLGVGAVVLFEGRLVLVKRAHEPLKGQWNLPGGGVELGETLEAACAREVLEETGLVVQVGPVIEVFDRIMRDAAGAVQYHFVLVDYLCQATGGALRCGSDASDIALADPAALEPYRLTGKALEVIAHALAL
jgi:8-oxo-dGTP diphosphatase